MFVFLGTEDLHKDRGLDNSFKGGDDDEICFAVKQVGGFFGVSILGFFLRVRIRMTDMRSFFVWYLDLG